MNIKIQTPCFIVILLCGLLSVTNVIFSMNVQLYTKDGEISAASLYCQKTQNPKQLNLILSNGSIDEKSSLEFKSSECETLHVYLDKKCLKLDENKNNNYTRICLTPKQMDKVQTNSNTIKSFFIQDYTRTIFRLQLVSTINLSKTTSSGGNSLQDTPPSITITQTTNITTNSPTQTTNIDSEQNTTIENIKNQLKQNQTMLLIFETLCNQIIYQNNKDVSLLQNICNQAINTNPNILQNLHDKILDMYFNVENTTVAKILTELDKLIEKKNKKNQNTHSNTNLSEEEFIQEQINQIDQIYAQNNQNDVIIPINQIPLDQPSNTNLVNQIQPISSFPSYMNLIGGSLTFIALVIFAAYVTIASR
jgi:hypothetical protein